MIQHHTSLVTSPAVRPAASANVNVAAISAALRDSAPVYIFYEVDRQIKIELPSNHNNHISKQKGVQQSCTPKNAELHCCYATLATRGKAKLEKAFLPRQTLSLDGYIKLRSDIILSRRILIRNRRCLNIRKLICLNIRKLIA